MQNDNNDKETQEYDDKIGRREVANLLLLHGCTIPVNSPIFDVLYEMAKNGQFVRLAEGDDGSYYEFSSVAIAIMHPYMMIELD